MATAQLPEPKVDPNFAAVAAAMSGDKTKENQPLISPESESQKREAFFKKLTGKEAPPEKTAVETDPHPEAKVQEKKDEKVEKKQPFQKIQAETRRKLEEENQQLKTELQNFKEKELPTLTTTIEELKKQIEGTNSQAKSEELTGKLKEYEEMLNSKTEENQKLSQKVEIFDFQNSDRFQKEYVAPLNHAYGEVLETLYGNPEAATELQKAIVANEAYVAATDPAEKQRQFLIRNEILGGIRDTLQPYVTTAFDSSTGRLWELAKKRNEAVVQQSQLSQKWNVEAKEKEHAFRQRWNTAYETAEKEVSISYPEELAKIIKEQKIDDSIDGDSDIAQDLIHGGTKYTPEEYSRVIQQGRNFKRVEAQLKAKDVIIKQLESNIAKLQGSSTSNGDPAPNPNLLNKPSNGLQGFKAKYGIK